MADDKKTKAPKAAAPAAAGGKDSAKVAKPKAEPKPKAAKKPKVAAPPPAELNLADDLLSA
jgi:hypothetical protein